MQWLKLDETIGVSTWLVPVNRDQTGAGPLGKAAVKAKEVVIGSHETLMYQQNTKRVY